MNPSCIRFSLLLGAAALLAGCESFPPALKSRFDRAPEVRTVDAGRGPVFAAAVASLKEMNYTIRRSRAREGIIDATGRIHSGSSLRGAQQYTLHIEMEETSDGRTSVAVEARESLEEQGAGGTVTRSERQIPPGAPHHRFFEELQRHLAAPGR